jgi:hypothetical protein
MGPRSLTETSLCVVYLYLMQEMFEQHHTYISSLQKQSITCNMRVSFETLFRVSGQIAPPVFRRINVPIFRSEKRGGGEKSI